MAGDVAIESPRRHHIDCRDVVVQGQADLLEVVGARDAPGRLSRRLHRRKQERDQDRDDGDHDEQLDQCKSTTLVSWFFIDSIDADSPIIVDKLAGSVRHDHGASATIVSDGGRPE